MKFFLSGLESSEKNILDNMIKKNEKVDYMLSSYYYLRKKPQLLDKFKKVANEILIDSGAHSFQKGKKVEWEKYTKEYAKEQKCKVHCLGMTRIKIMNKIPFDTVDSSTWKQAGNFGEYRKFANGKLHIFKHKGRFTTEELDLYNFKEFIKMQLYYKNKWKI